MDCVFPKPAKSGESVIEPVRSMIVHTAWMEVSQPCHSSGRKAGTEYGTLHGNTSHALSGCGNDAPHAIRAFIALRNCICGGDYQLAG